MSLLWSASALNSAASWVMQVGIFIHVLSRSGTSTLALVELIGTLPSLLWMPFAGAFADRHDVRRLALAAMAVQAVAVVGVLLTLGVSPWAMAACYGLQGAANAVWPPSRQRWLYAVVPVEGRAAANAAIGSVAGVMTIVGAALGGALSAWSITAAVTVAAALQLAAVLPLALLGRPGDGASAQAAGRRPLRADLVEGISALRDLPLARSVIWIGIAWGFIGGAYNVLLAAYVTRQLHCDGLVLGAFYVVDGVAVIVGSALAARVDVRRHLAVYALAYVVQGLGWGAMFLPDLPAAGAGCLAVMRVASGLIIALDTTILLATVPDRLRGRTTSVHMTTYNGVSRLSLAVFGGVLAAVGVRAVGVATGAASVLFGLLWWLAGGRRAQGHYTSAVLAPPETSYSPVGPAPEGAP